ncbi:MAG: carbonic anhydrase [Gammaproteobacteria bacterium]
MSDISALVTGFNKFKQQYVNDRDGKFKALRDFGQTPEIMMIACCDSRVDPAIITNSEAGDILVVRNIANLVPPYSSAGQYTEIHAAIEYGVCYLRVKHIIVMGHSRCGGIRSLITRMVDEFDPSHPLDDWTSIAEPIAREVLDRDDFDDLNEKVCECSRLTLGLSLDNLLGYPWVAEAVEHQRLALHAWYFDLSKGELERLDPDSGEFSPLT